MPVFRSALQERLAGTRTHQSTGGEYKTPCAAYEINALECLEAYGYWRGERACRRFYEDFNECVTATKQVSLPRRHSDSLA